VDFRNVAQVLQLKCLGILCTIMLLSWRPYISLLACGFWWASSPLAIIAAEMLIGGVGSRFLYLGCLERLRVSATLPRLCLYRIIGFCLDRLVAFIGCISAVFPCLSGVKP
jgi:ABC-type nitrate/sulfonate/bicarbonate transport system permease component